MIPLPSALIANVKSGAIPDSILLDSSQARGCGPLIRQGLRPQDSPLRVRKTRENLRPWHDAKHDLANTMAKDAIPADGFSIQFRTIDQQLRQWDISKPVQRRRSVRKRVVSRMRDGILGKSRSAARVLEIAHSSPTPEYDPSDGAGNQKIPELHASTMNEICSSQSSDVADSIGPEPSVSGSADAMRPTTSIGGTFTGSPEILSPIERYSNTPIGFGSPSSQQTPRPAHRMNPQATDMKVDMLGTLQVGLSAIATVDAVDIAARKTIWVMVEARAIMPITAKAADDTSCIYAQDMRALPQTRYQTSSALDIVVVIDNSQFVSAPVMHDMKAVLEHITNLLQGDCDRLAVFGTHCQHPGTCPNKEVSGCQLHALQSPDLARLTHELRHLEPVAGTKADTSCGCSPAEFWDEVVCFLSRPDANHRSIRPELTHVIILSPKPQEFASTLYRLRPWPVHQFRCGLF
ncbi:hypothetical protein BDV97DRAFT_175806 [Delphinella strobiligena]|nr:hypothetical protein BDV97DRAFT_175806 [Delphinella strobiligena]